MYDIQKIREDFPILDREVYGKPLIYLDNGATTQKPRQVVEAITDEYYSVNANRVHTGHDGEYQPVGFFFCRQSDEGR